jgi:hypothetical protein
MQRAAMLLALAATPCLAQGQDTVQGWPELDVYANLTPRTRLYFIAALSNDHDTRDQQGEFGPNFDYFLRPMARRRLRDKDPAKSKFLTLRAGYRYLPVLRGPGENEHRPIVELTPRYYLPWDILLSDRSRMELRYFETKPFSWRYRNRLTLERGVSLGKYEFTPYLRGEIFYDSRYGSVAKNIFTAGSVFPLTKRSEIEFFYEDQRDSSQRPLSHARGLGIVLTLYF